MSITVLFDLDGTLIDSQASILEAYEFALEPVAGGFEELLRMGIPTVMRRRMTEIMAQVAGGAAAECAERYDNYYRNHLTRGVRPYPGAPEMLAALWQAGAALGIVTNKGRTRIENDLRCLTTVGNDPPHFDTIVATEDTEERKPSPAPIQLALRRIGRPTCDAVMVGDGPHDGMSAKGAGIAFIGVSWGYYGSEVLRGGHPEAVVDSVPDLRGVLERRLSEAQLREA